MNTGRRFAICCLVCAGLGAALAAPSLAQELVIRYFNVGQADAALVTCPHGTHQMLIDTGDTRYPGSSQAFREQMESLFGAGQQKQLEVVIASHPHADHLGSMFWLLKNFQVDTYVDNGQKFDTALFGKINQLRQVRARKGELVYIRGKDESPSEIDFCSKLTTTLIQAWPGNGSLTDPNDRSVGVSILFGQKRFLFMGDMEDKAEQVLLEKFDRADRQLLNADVIKVGHHGSDTSSTKIFVDVVSPEHAIICCGKKDVGTNKGYKHPRASTIHTYNDALEKNELNGHLFAFDAEAGKWRSEERRKGLWATSVDGTITVRSDGQQIQVSTEK